MLRILVAVLVFNYVSISQPVGGEILQRGQDFRVVQTRSGGRYTELRNGMHYFEAGEWKETVSEIIPTAAGAVSLRGPHKLILPKRLTPGATVSITTTDGKTLRGCFSEIRYSESATGRTVTLGRRRNSEIELLPPNQAIYRDVSDGITADLLITYTSSGIESDIVLREAPQSPESLGLDRETTTLQVLTEFSEHPVVNVGRGVITIDRPKRAGSERILIDENIDLGEAIFAKGTAFSSRANLRTNTVEVEYPVLKQWVQNQSKTTLIESVDYLQCEALLNALPASASNDSAVGFTIDYRILNSNKTASFGFNDETYWVQPDPVYTNAVGSFLLSGPVTIQPGAVIKFNRNASLVFSGPVSFINGNAPIIFTAADDNSIGESVSIGAPVGRYATYAFSYNNTSVPGNNVQLTRCQFRYCQTAVKITQNIGSSGAYNLTTCKFDSCTTGVVGSSLFPVNLINPSFSNTGTQTAGSLTAISYSGTTYSTSGGDGNNGINQAGGGGKTVPDTMGAIGPDYLVETVNSQINVYQRGNSSPLESASVMSFFNLNPKDDYPVNDIRVLFDSTSQRWYIFGMQQPGAGVIWFAYSADRSPVGLLSSVRWSKMRFALSSTTGQTDFPSIGFDSNGIYCSYVSSTAGSKHSLIAVNKYRLFSGISGSVTNLLNYDANTLHPGLSAYPCVCPDAIGGADDCYLLMKCHPTSGGGEMGYRRFHWNADGGFTATDTEWILVDGSQVFYRSYEDLDVSTLTMPQKSPWPNLSFSENGSKIGSPVLRSGKVYVVWPVGLNSIGSNLPMSADRTGIEFMRLSVGGQLVPDGYCRIFDSGATPLYLYVPSVAVNLLGDSIVSFNGSNGATPLSCYYSVIPRNSFVSSGILPLYSGTDGVIERIGDISSTVVDPVSDLDVWSFQEWGDGAFQIGGWGTRIQRIHNP